VSPLLSLAVDFAYVGARPYLARHGLPDDHPLTIDFGPAVDGRGGLQGFIYDPATFVQLDGGQLSIEDIRKASRWRRLRRAWSWVRTLGGRL
jgi:hypothetical protein